VGRYFSALLALAAGVGTYFYNASHEDEKLVLLGLNLFFGDDQAVLADRTWQLRVGVGLLWLTLDLIRARRVSDPDPESD